MLTKHTAYKYETPYTGLFVVTQCFTNGTVNLQCGLKKLGIIYVGLSHINLILKLKIGIRKICLTMSAYDHQLYTIVLTIKAWKKQYNQTIIETLTVKSSWPCREVFITTSFLYNRLHLFIIGDALGKVS